MATAEKEKDRCWLCNTGTIVETIEENYEVKTLGTEHVLPRARVGRCDHCHQVLYALREDSCQ